MISITRKYHRRKRKRRHCDACDCDGPDCCDFGLFSTMLMFGSTTAAVTRAPAVDRAGLVAIKGYRRFLSHRWPGQCRYEPSCSTYGLAAVETYGLARGGRMAAARLRRCTPHVPRGTHDPLG